MPGINLKGETEESLVAALRQRKQKALSLLYDAYAPVLLGVISRIVKKEEIAEEVLKETFVAIWSRISVYDSSKTRFLTWGLALARGIALEALKSGKYQSFVVPSEKRTFANEEANLPTPLQNDRLIIEAFEQLKPSEKAILDLLYNKGFTCSEAAQELSISEEALRASLKSAFLHLGAEKAA